ncbi:MAG: hypothetical protein JXB17_13220 [Bacteroidales bacterium]|nr:hypothetical protein [Bacteroidales bacterium]
MKDSDLIFGLMASFGKMEYSIEDLMHLAEPFGVSENSLRTNLSRMKKDAVLESRKERKTAYYKFCTRGKKMNAIADLGFNPPEWENWNNEWFGVIFSISEKNKETRYRLKKRLSAYRFVMQYPGFWIRPARIIENEKYDFVKNFNTHYSKLIKFSYDLMPEINQIQALWNILNIHKEFQEGIIMMNKIKLGNLKPEAALKFKVELGNNMVKLILKDPLLPPIFLPADWKGKELRKKFFELDKQLTEISKPYWNKIFIKT